MLTVRRPRVAAVAALAVVIALGGFGTPAVRDALADRAQEAEWRRRGARVCPPQPGAPAAASARDWPPLARRGQVFVSHGWSRSVSILDLATGEVTRLPAGVADAHEVAVSPDGRWGVAADFGDHKGNYAFDGRRLAVFDLAAKKLARVVDLGAYRGPHDLFFLPGSSSRLVVTTQTDRHVIEVDIVAGTVLGATETRAVGSHTLAVADDGRTAYTANEPEASISRLDLGARAFVAKHTVGRGKIEGIAVTPDGREVWVGLDDEGVVRAVDGASGAVRASLPNFVRPNRLTMSPDGRRLLVTDFQCEAVRVIDVASRRELGSIAGLGAAGAARVLPDNRVAIIALLDEREIVVADLDERRVLSRHKLASRIDAAAWGPTPGR